MTGPVSTTEPGAISFIEDPYATGLTDDEITIVLNGGELPRITVRSLDPSLTAAQSFEFGPLVPTTEPAVVAAADVMTGAMIAFAPSDADAERLALPDGEPQDQLHCTSIYLGDAVDFGPDDQANIIDFVKQLVDGLGVINANVFGFDILNPGGDQPCLVLNVGGSELADAQEILMDVFNEMGMDLPDQHQPWLAHITLIYEDDPRTSLTDDVLALAGPIVFDKVRVAFAGDVTDIPLDDGMTAAIDFHLVGKHNQKSHAHGQAPLEQVPPKKMKKRQGEFEGEVHHAHTGDAAVGSVGPNDPATQGVLDSKYAGNIGYYDVNQGLRNAHGNVDEVVKPPSLGLAGNHSPHSDNEDLRNTIHQMDAGMDAHHLDHSIVTTRVISNPAAALGSHYTEGDLSGLTWKEHGFVSTHTGTDWHTEDQIIRLHGGADNMYSNKYLPTVTMRILVPRGAHALNGQHNESEVILDRGQTFRVVKDHGIDANMYNTRRIDVEVIQQ